MKKKLDAEAVMNELREGSSFFQHSGPDPATETVVSPPTEGKQKLPSTSSSQVQADAIVSSPDLASQQENKIPSKDVSKEENKKESLPVSNQDSVEDTILDAIAITPIKPNTFRYSLEELNFVRDAAYDAEVTYHTKLDKNDIVRIALEWLMLDYQEKDEASLLVSILTRKKARR